MALAAIAAALTSTSPATAVQRTAVGCGQSLAPKLCSIHQHWRLSNRLRGRMGQPAIAYHWRAERHPLRRGLILTGWTRVHRRTLLRWLGFTITPVATGKRLAANHGWTGSQWTALYILWNRESGWEPCRHYPSSTDCSYTGDSACGIPQRVPCAGLISWPAAAQIRWGIGYIDARYGTPAAALAHSDNYGWY